MGLNRAWKNGPDEEEHNGQALKRKLCKPRGRRREAVQKEAWVGTGWVDGEERGRGGGEGGGEAGGQR